MKQTTKILAYKVRAGQVVVGRLGTSFANRETVSLVDRSLSHITRVAFSNGQVDYVTQDMFYFVEEAR